MSIHGYTHTRCNTYACARARAHTHYVAHAGARTHTHARTHARARAHTHTHTHTQGFHCECDKCEKEAADERCTCAKCKADEESESDSASSDSDAEVAAPTASQRPARYRPPASSSSNGGALNAHEHWATRLAARAATARESKAERSGARPQTSSGGRPTTAAVGKDMRALGPGGTRPRSSGGHLPGRNPAAAAPRRQAQPSRHLASNGGGGGGGGGGGSNALKKEAGEDVEKGCWRGALKMTDAVKSTGAQAEEAEAGAKDVMPQAGVSNALLATPPEAASAAGDGATQMLAPTQGTTLCSARGDWCGQPNTAALAPLAAAGPEAVRTSLTKK